MNQEGSMTLKVPNPFAETEVVRKHQNSESVAFWVFLFMTVSMTVPLLAILGYMVYEALPAISWEFVTAFPAKRMTAGGLWTPIVGTIYLVLFSLFVAAPIGILAAIYLNEYAKDNWFTRIVNLAVVNLAGVPSIVYALFGVGAFVVAMGLGKSILAAAMTLGIMNLPVIIAATREALAAVPMPFREACWNMGASRWQTIRTVVLPNSFSGILTGVILEVCRAAGETAPIMFTGAIYFKKTLPSDPFDQCMALSYHLHTIATQVQGVSTAYQYGTAVVLIGLILALNSVAIGIRFYLRSRKKW